MVVLLQTGKGSDISAAFGGGSQTVFGSRGATTFLAKLTTGAAAVFMLTSITLAHFSSEKQENSLFSQEKKQEAPLVNPKDTATTENKKEETKVPTETDNKEEEQNPVEEKR